MSSVSRLKKSKYWYARYRLPNGKRATRSTKLTDKRKARELAQQWEEAALGELSATHIQRVMSDIYKKATGTAVPSFTVREYLNKWTAAKVPQVTPSSGDKYRSCIAEFIRLLGNRADQPLRLITEADLVAFRDASAKLARNKTTNGKLTMLAAAFRDAWMDGYLPDDIAKRLKRLKLRGQESLEKLPFTQEQVDKIIKNAEGEWKGITTLGAYTGQRLGDLVNLRWGDAGQTMLVFTSRKTRRKMRVPLHPLAAKWLAANRGEHGADRYIFPKSQATFVKNRCKVAALSKQFRVLLSGLGYSEKRVYAVMGKGRNVVREFSPLSFHSFRHFLTSQLHRAGVAPAVVRDIIGHDSEMVNRIYTDIDDDTKVLGIRKFEVTSPQPPAPPSPGGVVEPFPVAATMKEASNA